MSKIGTAGEDTRYGCLYCRAGAEDEVIRALEECTQDVEATRLVKKRRRVTAGRATEETVSLLPGYVFFRAPAGCPLLLTARMSAVYRVLRDTDGSWHMRGPDEAFARRVFETGGVVGLSQAWFEGDRIRIQSGFLKDYEGNILRVNKRRGTAQVRFTLDGREVLVWLGYELMEKLPDETAAP